MLQGLNHTGHYAIQPLAYFEYIRYVRSAREKELKRSTRQQKVEIIERINPSWEDLFLSAQHPSVPESAEADSLGE